MTKLKPWNNTDLDLVARGLAPAGSARTEEIEALVDTVATMLVLPIDVCTRLGLPVLGHKKVKLADETLRQMPHGGSLRLSILGREMVCDALAVARRPVDGPAWRGVAAA